MIAAANLSGTESATPKRHWPSVAIEAPSSSPSRSRTTVESGSSNGTTGTSAQKASSRRPPVATARKAGRRSTVIVLAMWAAVKVLPVSGASHGGPPAPRRRGSSRGWGTCDPREALSLEVPRGPPRANARTRAATIARTKGASCYWPGATTSTHWPLARALRVASYIASTVTIGR